MTLEKVTEIQNWQTVLKERQQKGGVQCQEMKFKYKDKERVKCKKEVKMLENIELKYKNIYLIFVKLLIKI